MRTRVLILAGMMVVAGARDRFVVATSNAALAPCIKATDACTEWVALAGGPARSRIYRSHSLDTRNDAITRALIMIHGTNRNADDYFETALASAFLAGALEDTVVISPHFIACQDKPESNEVLWSCNGDSWRSGGSSPSHATLTSFDFMDEILRKLATKTVFPNMRAIVVAGHSAGGQFVSRYEMSNRVHEALGVAVTYVVANPSSYAWPVAVRPLAQGDADPAAAKDGWSLMPETTLHKNFTYGDFDATKAPNYNRWPMGLENRTTGYTVKMSDEQLRKQLIERPTVYLLGQVDTLPLGGFDSSAGAMAQGPTRRARGEAFFKYLTEQMGSKARAMIVPECGHNNRCIFTDDSVLPVIFPKQGV